MNINCSTVIQGCNANKRTDVCQLFRNYERLECFQDDLQSKYVVPLNSIELPSSPKIIFGKVSIKNNVFG